MHSIYDDVRAYSALLDVEYEMILGRKGKLVHLNLRFHKEECHHLMGLQKLTDRPQFKKSRNQIFDEILSGKLLPEEAETSHFYSDIENRVDLLAYLEELLDSNDTVFKYNEKVRSFSHIPSGYLLENEKNGHTVYLFLSQREGDDYYCRSFFPKEEMDYSMGQAKWSLLYKVKRWVSAKEEQVLYNKALTFTN